MFLFGLLQGVSGAAKIIAQEISISLNDTDSMLPITLSEVSSELAVDISGTSELDVLLSDINSDLNISIQDLGEIGVEV